MFNIISCNNESIYSCIEEQQDKLRAGVLDNVVLRGLSVSLEGIKTPSTITGNPEMEEKRIIETVGSMLGTISDKGIENSIRFVDEAGFTNVETWHSHYQHDFTILFCLRGEKSAVTQIVSANTIMKNLSQESRELLLTPQKYLSGNSEFSLLLEKKGTYGFNPHIFTRSDLEETIKDLDLPDAMKFLQNIKVISKEKIS